MAQVETSVPVQALTVGGETLTGDETRVVRAPWDGAAIAAVPLVGATETRRAVAAAAQRGRRHRDARRVRADAAVTRYAARRARNEVP